MGMFQALCWAPCVIRQVVTVLSDFGIRKLRAVKANNYSMAISSLGETQLMLFPPGVFLLRHISRHEKACEQARRLLEEQGTLEDKWRCMLR